MSNPPAEPSVCRWCGEVLLDAERNHTMRDCHHECAVRQAAGSLAHIEMRCSCFVPGAEDTDPPELTKREAAIAAYKAYNLTRMITNGTEH